MSPRKVNKNEKRREIALSCFDLIHEVGMKNLTVAQVANTAGIGKGTVYEYFDNKEDILFEIINIHIETHHEEFVKAVKELNTIREKIELFFRFVLVDNPENKKHFDGYKEFLSIVLTSENKSMKEFNCDTNEFFRGRLEEIIQEGIDKNEIIEESINLVDGIITYQKGMALRKMSQYEYDAKKSFDDFMDSIFRLIEVKK